MIVKQVGIVCFYERKSEKISYIEVLASDSVYYKGITYFNGINKGMQISFSLVLKQNNTFFIIEDMNNFFGYFFWDNYLMLDKLNELLDICSKYLPSNIFIENLYQNFIYQLKFINDPDIEIKTFKDWILSLS